jgi:DNA transformation protein and related proteins
MDDANIRDMFSSLGNISIKKMVGVKEGYTQGFIVSIELDSEILLKADAQSATQFEAAGFKH